MGVKRHASHSEVEAVIRRAPTNRREDPLGFEGQAGVTCLVADRDVPRDAIKRLECGRGHEGDAEALKRRLSDSNAVAVERGQQLRSSRQDGHLGAE